MVGVTPGRMTQLTKAGGPIETRFYLGREMVVEESAEAFLKGKENSVRRQLGPKSGEKPLSRKAARQVAALLPSIEPDRDKKKENVHKPPRLDGPKKKFSDITEDDFNLIDDDGNLNSNACRAWAEFEKAKKLYVERLAVEGKYVEVAEIQKKLDEVMIAIKKGVMNIPSRLRSDRPETPEETIEFADTLCRDILDRIKSELQ